MKKNILLTLAFAFAACGNAGEERAARAVARLEERASAEQAVKRKDQEILLARQLLKEVKAEEEYGPGWANAVLRGNDTLGEVCELINRFSAGKEFLRLMKDMEASDQTYADVGVSAQDFSGLWRGLAADTAPAVLRILQTPPSNLAKCVRDGTIVFLHDELKLVQIVVEALKVYAPGPATIGSSEQELRDFLVKGAKRFVEKERPRLKESADAQGSVQWLNEYINNYVSLTKNFFLGRY